MIQAGRGIILLVSIGTFAAVIAAPAWGVGAAKARPRPAAISAVHPASPDDDVAAEPPAGARPVVAEAPAPPPALVTLGVIDGETSEKFSAVTIRLDRAPAWKAVTDIQDHGSFLQLTLPGTLVPEPGRFYDGGNPHLPKVAVFQLTPSDAAIRLFTNKDAARVRQAVKAELLGNRVVITVDHAKLAAALAAAPAGAAPVTGVAGASLPAGPLTPAVGPAPEPTADAVIARTEVRHDLTAPSELLRHDRAAAPSAPLGTGGTDLRQKLVTVTVFSVIMLCLLGASALARPYLRRRRAGKGLPVADIVSLKTLASMQVAARQKVSLIQVGDERILIGVSAEAVTFLTAVGRSAAPPAAVPQNFQRFLGEQAETVELRPAPTLKNLEGNDPETLRERPRKVSGQTPAAPASAGAPGTVSRAPAPAGRVPSPHGAPVKAKAKPAPSRINVSVGDEGVTDLRAGDAPPPAGGQKAIDDVTRMIREKLKTLRTI